MIIKRDDYSNIECHYGFPQYVLQLEDVYIGDRGLIFDKNFEVIKEASIPFMSYETAICKNERSKIINNILNSDKNIINAPDANYVACLNIYNIYPFGHLFDSLQQLYHIEKYKLQNSIVVRNRRTCHCNEIDIHLNFFGYDKSYVVLFHGDVINLYHFSKLWISSLACPLAGWNPKMIDWIRSKYPSFLNAPPTKLYLARNSLGRRGVVNEQIIIDYLKSDGYVIVNGNEPIEEKIKLFTNAEVIIFPHGSLIKHMIFCRKNPLIVEFCPDTRRDVSFLNNAKAADLTNYHQIFKPCNDKWDIELSTNEIKSLIDQYIT